MDIYLKRFEGIFNGIRKTRLVKETHTKDRGKIKVEYTYEYPYN